MRQTVRLSTRQSVTGKDTFTYTLPKKPYQAAIDPDHLFFDRVPDDNLKKVEVE